LSKFISLKPYKVISNYNYWRYWFKWKL